MWKCSDLSSGGALFYISALTYVNGFPQGLSVDSFKKTYGLKNTGEFVHSEIKLNSELIFVLTPLVPPKATLLIT